MSDLNNWHLFSASHVLGAMTHALFQPHPLLETLLNFWDVVLSCVTWSTDSCLPLSPLLYTPSETLNQKGCSFVLPQILRRSGGGFFKLPTSYKNSEKARLSGGLSFWTSLSKFLAILFPPLPALSLSSSSLFLALFFFYSLPNSQFQFRA